MDIDAVVAVTCFCILLWQFKRAMYLPAIAAVIFSGSPIEASFAAYICVLLFGTIYLLMDAFLDIGDM